MNSFNQNDINKNRSQYMNIVNYIVSIVKILISLDQDYRDYMENIDKMRAKLKEGDIEGVKKILDSL